MTVTAGHVLDLADRLGYKGTLDAKAVYAHFDDPAFRLALQLALEETMDELADQANASITKAAVASWRGDPETGRRAILKAYLASRISKAGDFVGVQINGSKDKGFKESDWQRKKGQFYRYRGEHPVRSSLPPANPQVQADAARMYRSLGFDTLGPNEAERWGKATAHTYDYLGRDESEWGPKLRDGAQAFGSVANGKKAQAAVDVADFAGTHGPAVEHVLKPKFLKHAYRYRAYEAPEQFREDLGGRQPNEPVKAYEIKLAKHLASKLPNSRQIEVALRSGNTPPSEGYILNAKGQVVHQGRGIDDDYYTPFNLKMLSDLKGGSYVRTRTYGGLTPEDLYIAQTFGAKRATVVSKFGVYSVEFVKPVGAKKRMIAPEHRELTGRYGRILDTIDNGKIPDPEATPVSVGGEEPQEFIPLEDKIERHPDISGGQQNYAQIFNPTNNQNVRVPREKLIYADADGNERQLTGYYNWSTGRWEPDPDQVRRINRVEEARVAAHNESVARKGKVQPPLRLDHRGYAVALDSLQQQFPYQIKTEFLPTSHGIVPAKQKAANGMVDRGYIGRDALRPYEAWSGRFYSDKRAKLNRSANRLGMTGGVPPSDLHDQGLRAREGANNSGYTKSPEELVRQEKAGTDLATEMSDKAKARAAAQQKYATELPRKEVHSTPVVPQNVAADAGAVKTERAYQPSDSPLADPEAKQALEAFREHTPAERIDEMLQEAAGPGVNIDELDETEKDELLAQALTKEDQPTIAGLNDALIEEMAKQGKSAFDLMPGEDGPYDPRHGMSQYFAPANDEAAQEAAADRFEAALTEGRFPTETFFGPNNSGLADTVLLGMLPVSETNPGARGYGVPEPRADGGYTFGGEDDMTILLNHLRGKNREEMKALRELADEGDQEAEDAYQEAKAYSEALGRARAAYKQRQAGLGAQNGEG